MKYPATMDPECIRICDALNVLQGIETFESCCGHGERPFRIFFGADTIAALLPILTSANSSAWHVEVKSATNTKDFSDIAFFMLEGPVGPPDMLGGANEFAGWIFTSQIDDKNAKS